MASVTITVSQLRTLVAAIPASFNTSLMIVPPESPLFPIVNNYTIAPDGTEFFTVRGYLDLQNKNFITVP